MNREKWEEIKLKEQAREFVKILTKDAYEHVIQQERERILSLPKYDLSKRGVDGELYIKVEDIKTLK